MKSVFVFIAFLSSTVAFAQQNAFTNVTLQQVGGRETIIFNTLNETNVKCYRVEASNNNSDFEVVGTVPSKANSVLPAKHSYDVTAYDFTYYRIAKVAMNGDMPYSEVVHRKIKPDCQHDSNIAYPTSTEALATR